MSTLDELLSEYGDARESACAAYDAGDRPTMKAKSREAVEARASIMDLFAAQSLELQELKAQRRDWLDKDLTARTMVAQEKELQAVREALQKARERLSDIAENVDCWGPYQMGLKARDGEQEARAALKPSRGAT